MQKSGETTEMVHYECHTCGVSATCVANEPASLAWLDHMENHAMKDNYSVWTWAVVPLKFGA